MPSQRQRKRAALLASAIWLSLAGIAWAEPVEPNSLALIIKSSGAAAPLTTPAQEYAGTLFIPVRPAVEYLGGRIQWDAVARKIVMRGPQGRQAAAVVGYPKASIDGKRWVRLPVVMQCRRGQVLASPETLAKLWGEISNQALSYDPKTRTLSGVAPKATAKSQPAPEPPKPLTKLRCVVIDAGHGGKDPGAIGPTQLQEKSVTLDVAQKLAGMVERELGCRVLMTRYDDRFIPLPERPQVANQNKADLFVSIHANASPDRKAYGSQVFIYNREASSRKAAEIARSENSDANFLEVIKDDLRQSVHESDSITMAGLISREFEKGAQESCRIERAPFYVLAKSFVPSVLVETAFISNPEEERKLRQSAYCENVAREILRGLRAYALEKK